MRILALFAFLATGGAAFAGEYAVFATGARLRVDRHELAGSKVRLYSHGGYSEMDASLVRAFEPEERVTAAPSPTAPSVSEAANPVSSVGDLADQAADRYGLPRSLVRGVISAESAFQPAAVSPKGAIGLMQLMPGTARDLGADPLDPAQNVDAGARYLRDLLLKYDGKLWHALAAYNAGPQTVDVKGIPPYRETINYINRVEKRRAAGQKSGN